jgi:hypothetical protein
MLLLKIQKQSVFTRSTRILSREIGVRFMGKDSHTMCVLPKILESQTLSHRNCFIDIP